MLHEVPEQFDVVPAPVVYKNKIGAWNPNAASYYFGGSADDYKSNHDICVIGWDDDFAASKTYTVKVTATSKVSSSYKTTKTITIKIASLPAWARGTFSGYSSNYDTRFGSSKISIGSTGKISAKFVCAGTNWTCSVTGFAAASESYDGYFIATGTAKAKIGKKTYSAPMSFEFSRMMEGADATELTGSLSVGEESIVYFNAIRNPWKDSSSLTKTFLAQHTGAYSWLDEGGKKVKLTVGTSGTVKIAGTLSNGRKVSMSAPLNWNYGSSKGEVVLYAAAASAKVGKKTVKYPEFFALVEMVNCPGTPVAGEMVAYRNPGVRAQRDTSSTGSGSISYSTAHGQAGSGKTVKVTATCVANKLRKGSASISVKVPALPSWARGTFKGTCQFDEAGTLSNKKAKATVTIGTTGKISGKLTVGSKSYSFTTSSYAYGAPENEEYGASITVAVGKTKFTGELYITRYDGGYLGFYLQDGYAGECSLKK